MWPFLVLSAILNGPVKDDLDSDIDERVEESTVFLENTKRELKEHVDKLATRKKDGEATKKKKEPLPHVVSPKRI